MVGAPPPLVVPPQVASLQADLHMRRMGAAAAQAEAERATAALAAESAARKAAEDSERKALRAAARQASAFPYGMQLGQHPWHGSCACIYDCHDTPRPMCLPPAACDRALHAAVSLCRWRCRASLKLPRQQRGQRSGKLLPQPGGQLLRAQWTQLLQQWLARSRQRLAPPAQIAMPSAARRAPLQREPYTRIVCLCCSASQGRYLTRNPFSALPR